MENKKYEFTGETITIDIPMPYECEYNNEDEWHYERKILHRIKAIRDFGEIHAGDLGGWIEKEENLSHDGDCWVAENASVYSNAKVYHDARVYGDAKTSGDAWVCGNAQVFNNARVSGYARVYGDAAIFGEAKISGTANVFGNTEVSGDTKVFRSAPRKYL